MKYVQEFIQIIPLIVLATTGNAKDFGDLSEARSAGGGTSNGHGGL